MTIKKEEQVREIKFRAWNKFSKEMFESFDMYEMVKGHLDYDEDEITNSKGFPVGTIFLQFTGRKDKNGKEIFEGDILKRKWGRKKREFNIYIVEQKEQRWAYPIENKKSWSDIFPNDEVIGNIYENPELLEETK